MKKSTLILFSAGLLLAVSCGKADPPKGWISFSLEEGTVTEIVTRGSVSSYATLPSAADFSLLIKNSLGATVYSGTLGAWKSTTQLAAGNYTVTASYGDPADEGPGKPCFEGSASFAVLGGQTSDVSIPVSLGNCIVTIACTEAFKNYYPGQTFVVTTPDNPAGFTYDGRGLFVSYQFSISGSLKTISGQDVTLPEQSFKGAPATCYTVKYDVSNVGGTTITVSFDDTVQTVTLEDVELHP